MSQWEFTGSDGTFRLERADEVRGVYFPLANEAGYMASICPDGGGDAKTDQNHFLMPPVSAIDLHNSRLKRTAWVCSPGREPWSVTGASHAQKSRRDEAHQIEAGLLWHRSVRSSASGEYEAEVLSFAPAGPETLEVSRIRLRNTGSTRLELSMLSVVPLYGRSADSLRDHRHVTALLNRVKVVERGVHLVPTMSFDERGHRRNDTVYSVLGRDSTGSAPVGAFPDLERFIGEAGDAEQPRVVFDAQYRAAERKTAGGRADGCEAIGALQFPAVSLSPGEDYSLYVISGVFPSTDHAEAAADRYCSPEGFSKAFAANRSFWAGKTAPVLCSVNDGRFEQWMRWVSVQPILRRIYGCSFLPYHDYGRGGRGWRDLWQDCLALLLMEPRDVRTLLLSNFAGVRFDGTNATIVGSEPGSFIADRNSIPRVWMDHGAWPVLTVKLYVDQSGDLGLLAEEQEYFSDSLWARASERIAETRTTQGAVYTGSVFEHMLLQQLSVFFNVGDHNGLRLEGADWNDGLDMAAEHGESVAFSSLYAANLLWLADAAERLEVEGRPLALADEILILLDRYTGATVNYNDPAAKRDRLRTFFETAKGGPSGTTTRVDASALAADLREKGNHLLRHIRETEWVESAGGDGWFNGYYDNRGQRVEGDAPGGPRMTLTGQVFSLLSGAATPKQVKSVIAAADRLLLDPAVGGYRLNTDFGEVKLDLGRCFGYAYGHKENGAMFSHMAVMYAYALFARGETAAASKVMQMMYRAAAAFERSRMYPGLPEYFDPDGRGLYCYLTGSASWYLLTVVTRMFGVRGSWGDLVLDPQLEAAQWNGGATVSVSTCFRGRQLRVEYANPANLDAGDYRVGAVLLNGSPVEFRRNAAGDAAGVTIPGTSLPESDSVITVRLDDARSGA
ncbi:MAG: cellobiose phosphorylase [Spirochaetaceae bacterium]|nr:MAG: cellobiose phosphorylase [Spirochaetaceae bacterium]